MPQIPQMNYAAAYRGLGQQVGQGISQVGAVIDEVSAWKTIQSEMKDFNKYKKQLATEIIQTMNGDDPRAIKNTYDRVVRIKDPKELTVKALAFKQQVDVYEQNKDFYKIKPTFGQQLETFQKANEPYAKLAEKAKAQQEQAKLGETVQGAVGGSPAKRIPETVGQRNFVQAGPNEGGGFIEQDITQRAQDIPGTPPAQTQQEAAGRMPPDVTTKQAESVPAYSTLPTEADISKQKAAEKKQAELQDYRTKMLAKGHNKIVVDRAAKNLEHIEKQQDRLHRQNNTIEKEVKSITTLLNKIKKGDQLEPEEIMEFEALGIPVPSGSGDEDTQVELNLLLGKKKGQAKSFSKKISDLENSYNELLDNPTSSLQSVLKTGRDVSETGFEAPPGMGGTGRIGRGGPQMTQSPQPAPAAIIPQRRGKPTTKDEAALKWAEDQLEKSQANGSEVDMLVKQILERAKKRLGKR